MLNNPKRICLYIQKNTREQKLNDGKKTIDSLYVS